MYKRPILVVMSSKGIGVATVNIREVFGEGERVGAHLVE
jgi:hypothetical protein